jgi:SAM-dependent methyltransferase
VSDAGAHWQQLYVERAPEQLSWYQPVPATSLSLIESVGLRSNAAILDVGGGTSTLAGHLLAAGYEDVTVVDIADDALQLPRAALGANGGRVKWIEADIRRHDFGREFDLWHDRAVFHFMVAPDDRDGYLSVLRRALRPGGHLILATFGPDGPTQCSGLPVARFGAAQLSEGLGGEFRLVSSQLEQHRTPGGLDQQFLYADFRRERER